MVDVPHDNAVHASARGAFIIGSPEESQFLRRGLHFREERVILLTNISGVFIWKEKEFEKAPGKLGKGNCGNVLQMREKGRGENETEL